VNPNEALPPLLIYILILAAPQLRVIDTYTVILGIPEWRTLLSDRHTTN